MNVRELILNFYVTKRFYVLLGICVVLFLLRFFFEEMTQIPWLFFGALMLALFADFIFLFIINRPPLMERYLPERFSNGDENEVKINLQNLYPFTAKAEIVDELPVQFQNRSFSISEKLKPGEEKKIIYKVRPVERGAYYFGALNVYFQSQLGLVERGFKNDDGSMVPVYPSFLKMRQFQLVAEAARTNQTGNKRIRKIGHSMEFEQIKEYVQGDDVRTINWKATARKGSLMVNNYTDEKSQQVYCVIDKGRLMKMPFNGLTLLDYAINASLVLCNVALHRHDKFGLITFDHKSGSVLSADKKPVQLEKVLQLLYNEKTSFLESNFEFLYTRARTVLKQRSLLILFTNFESLSGLHRQLPYLKRLAKYHLLVVVFFENTELTTKAEEEIYNLEGLYIRTIAGKFIHEKQLIVKELQNAGILSILSPPEKVTVNAINKYIEIKTRQAL
jgi:uncharacterized protein (DUF58 family)